MKDLLKISPSRSRRFLIVAGLTSSLLLIAMVNKFKTSGGLAFYIPSRDYAGIKRNNLGFSNTKIYKNSPSSIQAARKELHCKDWTPGRPNNNSYWPLPRISLQHLNLPRFLPNYKNPCWWSDSTNSSLSCLPYVYLAGFPKCGTTDLYFRLTQHPVVAPGRTKEPHYLTRFMYGSRCTDEFISIHDVTRCGINNYCGRYFGEAAHEIQRNEKMHWKLREKNFFREEWKRALTREKRKISHPMITVDGSASTAWDNKNWRKIRENRGCPEPIVGPAHVITRLNPNVRVIFILRNPTDRLYSDYVYFLKRSQPSKEDFHEKVQMATAFFKNCTTYLPLRLCLLQKTSLRLHIGIYHVFISNWLMAVPRSHLLVIHSETYRSDVAGTLAKIFRFLDLHPLSESAMQMIVNLKERNTSKKKWRVGEMLPETRAILRDFYSQHNEILARILKDERFAWREAAVTGNS